MMKSWVVVSVVAVVVLVASELVVVDSGLVVVGTGAVVLPGSLVAVVVVADSSGGVTGPQAGRRDRARIWGLR